ncbi:MAG: hypothetical protein AAF078_09795, partial [Planctomycetota bacterium]
MSQIGRRFCGAACLGLLSVPLLLSWVGTHRALAFVERVESRTPAAIPAVQSLGDVFSRRYWRGWSSALRDRVAFRGAYVRAKYGVDRWVLRQTRFGDVRIGQNGWLFLDESLGQRHRDAGQVNRALSGLQDFLNDPDRGEAELVFAVVPDKCAIYPQYLDAAGRKTFDRWLPLREQFRRGLAAAPDDVLVDVYRLYAQADHASPSPIYFKTDTHHNRKASPPGLSLPQIASTKARWPR